MILLRATVPALLGILLGAQVSAHGLNKVGDKAVLFKQHGTLLLKVEMTPNSINFNTENSLYISIIDQEAGRFYQGSVSASLVPQGLPSSEAETKLMEFDRGIYKTKTEFSEGGVYHLTFYFNEANDLAPAVIAFDIDDNRQFAQYTLVLTLSGIFIAIICLAISHYSRKRRTQTIIIKRRITCDT